MKITVAVMAPNPEEKEGEEKVDDEGNIPESGSRWFAGDHDKGGGAFGNRLVARGSSSKLRRNFEEGSAGSSKFGGGPCVDNHRCEVLAWMRGWQLSGVKGDARESKKGGDLEFEVGDLLDDNHGKKAGGGCSYGRRKLGAIEEGGDLEVGKLFVSLWQSLSRRKVED